MRASRTRRSGAGIMSAVGVIAVGVIGGAAPSYAATYSTSLTCSGGTATTPISLAPGDTYTIDTTNCTEFVVAYGAGGPTGTAGTVTYGSPTGLENSTSSGSPWATPPGTKIVYTATGVGTKTVNVRTSNLNPADVYSYQFTVTTGGGSSNSSDATGSPGPADIVQQFALPSSGRCDDGATAALNWSGVSFGGWGISWAQWPNNGSGGAVCSRELTFQQSSGVWAVR